MWYVTAETIFEIERIEKLIDIRESSFMTHPKWKSIEKDSKSIFDSTVVVHLLTTAKEKKKNFLPAVQNEKNRISFGKEFEITPQNGLSFGFEELKKHLEFTSDLPLIVIPEIKNIFGSNLVNYPNFTDFHKAVRYRLAPHLSAPD